MSTLDLLRTAQRNWVKLLFGFLSLLATPFAVAEAMRCGSRIVGPGTSSAELAALCGNPTQINKGAIFAGAGGINAGITEQVEVETWIYNFGPNQLMQRIRIENGVIVRMDSMGYGYNEP